MMIVPPPEGLELAADLVIGLFVVLGMIGVLSAWRAAHLWRREGKGLTGPAKRG